MKSTNQLITHQLLPIRERRFLPLLSPPTALIVLTTRKNVTDRSRPTIRRSAFPHPQAVDHEARNAENSAPQLRPKLRERRETTPYTNFLDVRIGFRSTNAALTEVVPDGHITCVDLNANILLRARAVTQMACLICQYVPSFTSSLQAQ